VRNVARHAGVPRADVTVTSTGSTVRVEVRDDGRGFQPAAIPAQRYGVRHSIVDRMASVGGQARVESAVDAGTRWILEWPGPGAIR
jgi:two-component system NarL family sensor kinase